MGPIGADPLGDVPLLGGEWIEPPAAAVIDIEGLEAALSDNRLHAQLSDHALHAQLSDHALHAKVPEG